MKVRKNYGGLELEYVAACPDCKLHHRQAIKGVPETSVEIISIPNQQGVKYA